MEKLIMRLGYSSERGVRKKKKGMAPTCFVEDNLHEISES